MSGGIERGISEDRTDNEMDIINSLPLVLPDDDGIRPAGKPDECFYCKQKVGHPHLWNCVALHRKVKVKYTFEIEIEVPHYWDKKTIGFHRNESSWCANNAINELREFEADACLCPYFHCDVIEVPEALPYRKNNKEEVVE